MPFIIPQILLPKSQIDLNLWSVIACDQFTSEPEYWQELQELIGDNPSTLHLTFPENYLGKNDQEYIKLINANMEKYLASDIFAPPIESFIVVERTTTFGNKRLGLMLAVDLEEYSFAPDSKSKIRATEGTIIERLPPRIKIRQHAPLEFPHIMLLIDDSKQTVIEQAYRDVCKDTPLYDFELNMQGGHIKGYKVQNSQAVKENILNLLSNQTQIEKYGTNEQFLFAVGDGNHSLATAKMCWNNLKPTLSTARQENHPARYALCELVNLYDNGLLFEPIHRYVEGVDVKKFMSGLKFSGENVCKAISSTGSYEFNISLDFAKAVAQIDQYIANYLKENGGSVDYVHGDKSLTTLATSTDTSIGIFMPKLKKSELFLNVAKFGSLPRKSFSMGEAQEKRYYLEGKKIK